jgi:hypothetical protein
VKHRYRTKTFRSAWVISQEVMITLIIGFVTIGVTSSATPSPWSDIIFLVGLAGVAGVLVRAFRISVVLLPDGIRVRNLWRTHFVRWVDVSWLQRSTITIGPLPTAALAIACETERRFVRILASAGTESSRDELRALLLARPELAEVEFRS